MRLALVSTSATRYDMEMRVVPHELRGSFVVVRGNAAYGKGQSECSLLGGDPHAISYVKNEDLHLFDVRKDVNGYVVLHLRPDGYSLDGPAHRTIEDACRWFAETCVVA